MFGGVFLKYKYQKNYFGKRTKAVPWFDVFISEICCFAGNLATVEWCLCTSFFWFNVRTFMYFLDSASVVCSFTIHYGLRGKISFVYMATSNQIFHESHTADHTRILLVPLPKSHKLARNLLLASKGCNLWNKLPCQLKTIISNKTFGVTGRLKQYYLQSI